VRLYPFLSAAAPSQERSIVIDPRIAFGRPVVQRKGISTSAIADRIDVGESVDNIAADYELGPSEIEHAVLYERAAWPLFISLIATLVTAFPRFSGPAVSRSSAIRITLRRHR
jgi:uncharacterized protein (DUF433 family)